MSFRQQILGLLRGAAGAVALALVVERAAAEAIQFSKPTLAIVAPPKPPENLPEARARSIHFSGPEVERPTIAPPRPLPPNPREEKRDERHWLLQDPKIFSDPERDREEANKDKLQTSGVKTLLPGSGQPRDSKSFKRPGSPNALSPEGDFN